MLAERVGFAPSRDERSDPPMPEDHTKRQILASEGLAERVGFEPTCRLPDKTLSRRPRYDHFGTSPVVCARSVRSG